MGSRLVKITRPGDPREETLGGYWDKPFLTLGGSWQLCPWRSWRSGRVCANRAAPKYSCGRPAHRTQPSPQSGAFWRLGVVALSCRRMQRVASGGDGGDGDERRADAPEVANSPPAISSSPATALAELVVVPKKALGRAQEYITTP